ncbi:hypothetical protein K2173_023300 [Erythroxylum novogranatense]|uniref:RING-type domain-containing protein n=1 Tax=Erythroxylum novogranatense TaxID=1862640 RepID=A0AAV8TA59_9ROSI|nr:hypothetical protein K2173_023300 [Erythroxylum novogranatense]
MTKRQRNEIVKRMVVGFKKRFQKPKVFILSSSIFQASFLSKLVHHPSISLDRGGDIIGIEVIFSIKDFDPKRCRVCSVFLFFNGLLFCYIGDSIEKIPKIKITSKNNVDTSGDKVSCSVCLQDFQLRETVRSLPHCHRLFHLSGIDKWLLRPASCPLCRRDL